MKYLSFILVAFFLLPAKTFAQPASAEINGQLSFLHDGDPVLVQCYKYGPGSPFREFFHTADTVYAKAGRFSFRVRLTGNFSYINIDFPSKGELNGHIELFNGNRNLDGYIIQPGDQIFLRNYLNNDIVFFNGKGSAKYNAHYLLSLHDKLFYANPDNQLSYENAEQFLSWFRKLDSLKATQLAELSLYKHQMDKTVYGAMSNEIIFEAGYKKRNAVGQRIMHPALYKEKIAPAQLTSWRTYMHKSAAEDKMELNLYGSFSGLSGSYWAYISGIYRTDSCLLKGKDFHATDLYHYITAEFTGNGRELLLTGFLCHYEHAQANVVPDFPLLVNSSMAYFTNPDFINNVKRIQQLYLKGVQLPDFALPDTNGVIHHLADYRGKVIVIDTWHNGCGACIAMAPHLAKVAKAFSADERVVFLSICCYTAKDKWRQLVSQETYSSKDEVNLFAADAERNAFLKRTFWYGDPTLMIIGKNGMFLNNPDEPGEADHGRRLTEAILSALKSAD